MPGRGWDEGISCLHEAFERLAAERPEAPALVVGEERLTYGELDGRANRLARFLREEGAGPETRVAVCAERTAGLVVALLAVLKAGSAYVPVDPAYPRERQAFLLADSEAPLLVTEERLLGRLPQTRARIVCLDQVEERSASPLPPLAGAGNLAYLIYTSGSTGQPKGVAIEHRSAVAFLRWVAGVFPPEALKGVLAATSVCFDLSVFEVFAPLSLGGTVILAENALELPRLPAAGEVTLVNTVPSAIAELARSGGIPASVRTINLAGEPLRAALVERLYRIPTVQAVYNLYGPSEATTYSTWVRLERGDGRAPSIGRPIEGTRVHLLDSDLRPVPEGELYLGGAGLARGYLGRPDLTAQRFVPDPFAGTPGERLYATGDLARFRGDGEDGELDFLGRIDHQVKIRGFRIELGEIESALERHPGVADTVVVAREREGSAEAVEKVLVAYVAGERLDVSELRAWLGRSLADYMVPAFFVVLPELPRTPNGKVDRAALPAPEAAAGAALPRTALEATLAGIWAEVLELPGVGAEDDFFALGGNSLSAARVLARIRETLGVGLPQRALFEAPTVARLAALLADRAPDTAGPAIPVAGHLVTSPAQEAMWFADRLNGGLPVFNIPLLLTLSGPLDVVALRRALGEIVRRHQALRVAFREVDGLPVPVLLAAAVDLPAVDLTALPDAARSAEAERLVSGLARRRIELSEGPRLAAVLLRLGRDDHRLSLTLHHAAGDDWSTWVLVREMAALYGGPPSPLPEPRLQYSDFAAWQRLWLEGEEAREQLSFWTEHLAGAPELLDLPADRPRPPVQDFLGGQISSRLLPDEVRALAAFARSRSATLFMALLAAFDALIHRLTGRDDVVVASPFANRHRPETQELIGLFTNNLVLRSDLSGRPGFAALLDRVRETVLAGADRQDFPFDRLIRELQPERSASHSPLAQVALVLQNTPRLPGELRPGLGLAVRELGTGTAKFDLVLYLRDQEGGLEAVWEYAAALFDAATVERIAGHFRTLLAAAVAEPQRPVAELPLLAEPERHQILVSWNDTAREEPGELVHEALSAAARRRPEAVAVAGRGKRLTYGALESLSNRLAHHLRELGVGPEARVAVCMERSPERIVGVAAILKAGGAYVSLDPAFPRERLAFLLADAGSPVLLTESGLLARLPESRATVLCLDRDWEAVRGREDRPPESGVRPENLAYVVYTSGSTGAPKGVEIPHSGLAGLVQWHRDLYQVTAEDRATQVANTAFDASVWEIWPYLAAGASIHIPAEEVRISPAALVRWWGEEGITLSFLPTPLAEAVLPEEIPPGLPLRALIVGGDRLHRGPDPGAGFRLMNHYGPSESSVVTTVAPVFPGGDGRRPPIGRPIDGTRVYVLDGEGQPVPVGVPGELYVGGAGLARGYLARPDLTAERFVPDPWAGRPGDRVYRTGDRVRWLPDGNLDFLGRFDHQVKVRGLRIELGEIEAVLARHPAVREAAVLLREDGRLAACVAVEEPRPGEESLRAFLAERLPDYMVPSAFVLLEALPLSPNGKVDRRALSRIAPEEAAEQAPVAPRSPLEEALAGFFREVLGGERVGVHDDFFALGGHSLAATQVLSRIRGVFGVDLPARRLFEAPTVSLLARAVEEALGAGAGPAAPPLERVPRTGPLPLSSAQKRLWFLDRLTPGSPVYNVSWAVRLRGPLDAAALERSLAEIVRRHEGLRTTFPEEGREPVQVIHPPGGSPLCRVDLSGLPDAAGEALRLVAREAARPFDLARGPLLRIDLLRVGEREHVLHFAVHHAVFDGWSLGVLLREMAALYRAFTAGLPSPLPELPFQYADFAVWQNRWLAGEGLAGQLAWWKEQLAGETGVLELPLDRPRPAVQSFRGGRVELDLPREASRDLSTFARRHGSTPFMVFLAVFDALLQRWSGRDDLSVGAPVANRNRVETEGLIGFFVNTIVLKTDLSGDPAFRDLLGHVREVTLQAYAHQDLPFERLVEVLRPERLLGASPLFQVMLAVQNAPAGLPELPGLSLELLPAPAGTSKFDLTLTLEEGEEGLTGSLEYAADLFDAPTIARMAGHFKILLAGALREPGRRLSDLPLLTDAEARELLAGSVRPVPRKGGETLHSLFAAQAARTPSRIAVIAEEGSLTYAELDRRSNRLARHLAARGVGCDARVGLRLERSLDLVVGMLGVVKAGGAYVPLDPGYPAERLAGMVADAGVALVLTDGYGEALAGESPEPFAVPVPDVALAYLIFTSGSTGRPKGAMVPHRAIVNHMLWMQAELPLEAADRVFQKTPFSFDASVWEFWAPLLAGAALVLARPGGHRDPEYLVRTIRERGITILQVVPSLLRALLADGRLGECRSLRRVFCGGEALTADVQMAFRAALDADLINLYGPTEAAIEVTSWRCPEGWGDRPALLGGPIENARLHVLGPRQEPCPLGVAGELCIGGLPVGRGYHARPEETAARFIPDPFAAEPGARLYRTGDLVRRLPGGALELLGRTDHQVKVRGFRIELGEVEAALSLAETVGETAVLALPGPGGDRRLVAYVAGRPGAERPAPAELRAFLKGRLPEPMVPTAWVILESLPHTPNGKVDRRALARIEPEAGSAAGPSEDGAPRTPVEERLAAFWAEILGVPSVGRHDHFFDLGGHSLLATRVISWIRSEWGVELPLRSLFEEPTVERLAQAVEAGLGTGGTAPAPAACSVPAGALRPLSRAQRRLWFLDQLAPGSSAYNLPLSVRLRGTLEPAVLASVLSEIARRHEVLRARFVSRDGEPFQVTGPAEPVPLPLVDLSGLPEGSREAGRLAAAELAHPFDLARGPLFKALLLRAAAGEHVLVAMMHHIVSDGWSVEILLRELTALYAAVSAGEPSPFPELPLQYADFAEWQQRWLNEGELTRQLAAWRERLAGAPEVLDLPTDRPRPPARRGFGSLLPLELPGALDRALRDVSRRLGATPFMLLLSAFDALLHRYTGEEQILVGTPIANRNRAEIEGLIGFFVNTLVLRADLSGDPSFEELAGRVREVTLEAYAHQDVPFEKLVEELRPARSLAHTPLFQVMLVYQSAPAPLPPPPGLAIEPLWVDSHTAKFDLTLSLVEEEGSLAGALEYSTDLFDRTTLLRLAAHWETLLAGALAAPGARLSELPLLTEAEIQQSTVEWNGGPAGEAGEPVHERFARRAAATPGAPAVRFEDEVLTYGELDARSRALARRLAALGAGPGSVVALLLERSPAMIVALLGALRAGGAYLPLDPDFPPDRLAFLLGDSGAGVLVTEEGRPHDGSVPVLALTSSGALADEGPEQSPAPALPEDLAYVIYTSGSTGRPKGVMVEHRQLAQYVSGVLTRMALPEGASFATVSTIAADLGNTMVFAALATGGCLHVVPRERLSDPFSRHPVDVLKIVPSHLEALLTASEPERSLPRRLLVLGGEASRWELIDRLRSLAPGCRILNHYGPTETTVGVLTCETAAVRREDRRGPAVPLGRPLPGVRILVLDRHGAPVPVGVTGEIHVGGATVSRGYLGRPDRTARLFLPDPRAAAWGEPGARVYATGDLGRLRPDGGVEFLGRADHQVKVRGFRVEPGEIETVLAAHPAVLRCAVLAREEKGGGRRLVAYWVPREGAQVDAPELRRALLARLPEFMVPAAFVALDSIPLTANGKVDRHALPDPEEALEAGWTAPRGPVEEMLASVWADLLGVARVGAFDDFFELGGHSLLGIRMVSRIRTLFGVDLPLSRLFESPTLAGLARILAAEAGTAAAAPLARVSREEPLPLSFQERRLWFLDRLTPGSPLYNITHPLRIEGPLDPRLLAGALSEVVRRHEVLRSVFPASEEGEPFRRVTPATAIELPRIDLSGLPAEAKAVEAAWRAAEELSRPFDLARGPVVRASLLRLGEAEHVLLFSAHHIVFDGWSWNVLLRELAALYDASPLPELPLQYGDFAVWQGRELAGGALAGQLAYWRDRLAGAPTVLDVPADHPRPAVQSFRGGARHSRLPVPAADLRELSRREGATLFMAALAAFEALLGRYTGRDDLLIGTPVANRGRSEIEGLIGFFVNVLPLRADLSGNPSFSGLLGRAREAALAAYSHQDLPFEALVEELRPERDLSRSPLFQVVLLVDRVAGDVPHPAGLRLTPLDVEQHTSKFDLTLSVLEDGDALSAAAEYASDLFAAATVDRFLAHFGTLLAGAARSPETLLSELPLLTAEERHQLLTAWNDTAAGLPDLAVHEAFAREAERAPGAVALVDGGEELTYGDLDLRANRLARFLERLGVGPERVVAIAAGRSFDRIVALLAVLKAGGAYLPLDPEVPAERLASMLEDSGAGVLVAEDHLLPGLSGFPGRVVALAGDRERIGRESGEAPPSRVGPESLAYVIYTSGSTGRPKGVLLVHRGLLNLVAAQIPLFGLGYGRRALQVASFGFDASVSEIFTALLSGATLVLADRDDLMPGPGLARFVRERRITTATFTPSALAAHEAAEPGDRLPAIETLVVAGEACPPDLAARWSAGRRLVNAYGPTEGTVCASAEAVSGGGTPGIGRPIANVRLRVLDPHLGIAPVGIPGEIAIGGAGVARGYLGRPELTAEQFVPDPAGMEPGERLYRTGDLGRFRADGRLEFLGRIDHQVKIRGFRIEPGEFDAALVRHPRIREAVVVAREDAPGGRRLVAYLVPAGEEGVPPAAELRDF
ncbi:MAG TPA: non-ribosomal peptide synthase/polyketide synthase, partial [Thermoanaerobaculia bacterium]|nr:non-ribosomal peptide synthase/polyketide synthase [Thermoanaerobaculia bacterium]